MRPSLSEVGDITQTYILQINILGLILDVFPL